MEMASTCSIDRVLLGLELLLNRFRDNFSLSHVGGNLLLDVRDAIRHMKFLKTFLMCARKWSLVHLYLQSDNVVKKVSLPSFLSCIEDTFHKSEEDIQSLCLRLEMEKYEWVIHNSIFARGVFREIEKKITSLKQEIIQIYLALASSRSFQSNSCMTDDELLEFIDLILQNLADLTKDYMNWRIHKYDPLSAPLTAQVQDLEAKLTFLKSFIPFAKMRGTADIPALLLSHFEVVALTAARLSYMWSFWKNVEYRSTCSFKLLSIRAVDFHVYEIYKEVLAASNSSASLHTAVMDERILNNFNDSLISRLWELLCCSSSFVDSMKDQMRILYAGLRFLRSILREHHEMMDEQNEKIGALLGEAGIIIFSPTLSRVIEGQVSFSGSTQVLDFCDMLASTNIHIKNFKDQISGSSTIESLPNSSHSLRAPEVSQTSSRMLSKGKMPIDHEVMVGLDDEAEKVIEPLVSSTIQSLPNSSHSLRAPEVSQTSSRMLSKGKMPIAREIMVGLDDEAAKVIGRLRWGSKQVEIVPIVGMAGLGKTTLAKKVYNDSSVTCHFHIRLWCTVSQEFNMKNVLLQILCSDGKHSRKDEFKNLDKHALLEKLYQRLLKNRYLVVFDDVWDIKVWNELRISFPDDKNQSRIIFTSRSSNVASQVQYGREPHKIRCLTVEESFELLQKKVFGEDEECPQALHELGMEIVKKCWGLPFAVVVVAGILATIKHDILLWEKFAESLTSTMVSGTDQWKKSLELSYEHLPYHLKACLLYFAAFPEDEKIGAKKLMCLWIAEGFVQIIEGEKSEDIAEEYLMDLIGRNLVMVGKNKSTGGVKTCYIHDLIFEFCKGKAKEKKFLQVLGGYDELSTFNEPPNLPRLSICSSVEDFIKSRLFCPHLASLLLFDATPRYDKLFNISFLFCIYKHLNVLNLEGINLRLKELPAEVESLLCLRYLALEAEDMQFIPPSIAKLSHLETFWLHSNLVVSLPDSIWNMKKLRHIHVRGRVAIHLPSKYNSVENLSTLPNLDTLSCLCLFKEGENLLRRIPNIRRLKISDYHTGNGVLNMSQLECLESLTWWGNYSSGSWEHVELPFPMNLKKLSLENLGLPCSKMSLIEELPNLEVLELRLQSMDGQRWELMEGGFPKLRVLTLTYFKVVEWTERDPDSDDYFPCLQQLNLDSARMLKMMPSCLGRISTLETIEIDHCGDRVKSLVREIEEAQKNYGNVNLEIIID